jgi:hypothetical protein
LVLQAQLVRLDRAVHLDPRVPREVLDNLEEVGIEAQQEHLDLPVRRAHSDQ